MSYLGIDLGTTGCKTVLFDERGTELAFAYREYTIVTDERGHAELDSRRVWNHVKNMIRECAAQAEGVIDAVSVSSLGEAMVPVSEGRESLGNSLLNFDSRGGEYLDDFRKLISDTDLYRINGNVSGPNYALSRFLWYLNKHRALYDKTYKFLLWGSYILFMLGADPVIDYSLANRTLLLDIKTKRWNSQLIERLGLDALKLPELAEAGSLCGRMSVSLTEELGLQSPPLLVVGTHDQCSNAVGCGVLNKGTAMYGMGTFHCIVSVFEQRPRTSEMLTRGLNTEHHAVPGRWVSFIYNQGGILLKWFRDTFAPDSAGGVDLFRRLLDEMPEGPSPVSVLPHFTTTGTPGFIDKTSGLIAGLTIDTSRGDICKGVLEGIAFYLKENLDNLPEGMIIDEFTAVGGGSRSDLWMQLTADILGRPCMRTQEAEAGALGAAILAACGAGYYNSITEAVEQMVSFGEVFRPAAGCDRYLENYMRYKEIAPRFGDFLSQFKK
ncbi:MAG: hypothetical protein JEZ04_11655 [Spirochaetales bacterium]|nr:hypothetical protein [Spirochaetales bacterium]